MPKTTDVAIVGGGVIGSAIAFYLSKRGIKATVFEKSRLASGASGATAGIIGPIWHIDHFHEAAFDLGLKSLDMFPELVVELLEAGIDPKFRLNGLLKIALEEEQVEVLMDGLAVQGELGRGVTWLDPDEVRDREPEISPRVLGGVFSPTEGHINGKRYVDSLVLAASRLGATFLEAVEVDSLVTDGDKVYRRPHAGRDLPRRAHGPCRGPLDGDPRPVGAADAAGAAHQGPAHPAATDRLHAQVPRGQLRERLRDSRRSMAIFSSPPRGIPVSSTSAQPATLSSRSWIAPPPHSPP